MKDGKIELAICTDGIFPHAVGGMQRHSRLLTEYLAKDSRFSITVYHPHNKRVFTNDLGVKEINIQGIEEGKNYLQECFSYSGRMLAVLQKSKPDVVYSQGLSVWNGIEKVASKLVLNPHGLEPFQSTNLSEWMIGLPFRHVFKELFAKAAVTISLGGQLTDILHPMVVRKGNQLMEVPNAVELGQAVPERRWDPGLTHVLFVGRFAANKGIDLLMSVIAKMKRKGLASKFHFHLVGKGPLHARISEKCKAGNVTFHGFVQDEDLTKLYAKADVFVLPTFFEGMPTVILEAMASGLPIIATDTGAIAELVDDTNGFLIERKSGRSLFLALGAFQAMDYGERKQLGKASRTKVEEQFSWTTVAQQYGDLFVLLAGG